MRFCVILLVAYLKAHDEVHKDIRPWAVWLRQWLHASMQPRLYGADALTSQASLSIGLDPACHAWPIVLPSH
jgi:hypothetical protein